MEQQQQLRVNRQVQGLDSVPEPPAVSLEQMGEEIREFASRVNWWGDVAPSVARRFTVRFAGHLRPDHRLEGPGFARRLLIHILVRARDMRLPPRVQRSASLSAWVVSQAEEHAAEYGPRITSTREAIVLSYLAYWTPGDDPLGLQEIMDAEAAGLHFMIFSEGAAAARLAELVRCLMERELGALTPQHPPREPEDATVGEGEVNLGEMPPRAQLATLILVSLGARPRHGLEKVEADSLVKELCDLGSAQEHRKCPTFGSLSQDQREKLRARVRQAIKRARETTPSLVQSSRYRLSEAGARSVDELTAKKLSALTEKCVTAFWD